MPGHSQPRRDYLVRIKGNQPEVLAALVDGFAGAELVEPEAETVEKKRAMIERTAYLDRCGTGRLYPG